MPELQYTQVSDYRRGISNARFSKLAFSERREVDLSTDVPDDPFAEEGWDIAAYKLLEAEQEMEDIISRQYEIPLESLPEHVKGWVIDLAIYKMSVRNAPVPDDVQERRDRAIERFRAIGDGAISLNLSEDEGESEPIVSTGRRSDSLFSDL